MACPPQSYCTVAECEESTRQGRIRCDFHEKRHQRGQPLTAPKAERLSPKGRLLEAAICLADADSEDDVEYQRRERALLLAARQLASHVPGEVVRQGMDAARRRGVHVGRPRAMTPEQARALVARMGSTALAAKAGKVSASTVRRALRRGAKGGLLLGTSSGDGRAERRRSASAR